MSDILAQVFVGLLAGVPLFGAIVSAERIAAHRRWWREVTRPMCGVCGEPWEIEYDARSMAKNIHHTCRPIEWRRTEV